MSNVPKMFGSLVFNETVMKDRLPTATYKTFKNAVLKAKRWICRLPTSSPMR